MAANSGVALDTIVIEIESSASKANNNLAKLTKTLTELRGAIKGGFNGLNKLAQNLKEVSKASNGIPKAIQNLSGLHNLTTSLKTLNQIEKPTGLINAINNLEKIPGVFQNINASSIENVKRVSEQLGIALTPLANKMGQIGEGYSKLQMLADRYGVSVTKVREKTQQTNNQMGSFQKTMKNLSKSVEQVKNSSNEFGKTGLRVFGKLHSRIKQMYLSLLGTRTIFTMIRKAVSEYMQMDQQLTKTTQNLWRALGAQLAPVIEYVLYLFKQGVRVIYSIVKALTGIDLISRANARAMASFGKSTKDTLGNLQKFDDLNVVDFGKDSQEVPQIELEEIDLSPIQKVIDWMKKLKATIEEAWRTGGWNEVAKVLAEGINGVVDYIKPAEIGEKIGKGILVGLNFVKTFISETNWKELGQKIGDTIRNMPWGEIWKTVGNIFVQVLKGFTGAIDGLFDFKGAGGILITFVTLDKIVKNIMQSGFSDIFKNMFGDADNLSGKMKNIGQAFSLMGKNTLTTNSISGITGVSKGLLNLMKPLSNVFGLITKGVGSLGLGPMVGIIAAIVVGIMALVKAFKNLYENSEPFRQTVDGLIASIKDYLLQCLDNLKTILTSLWEVLVVVWQQVIVPLFDLIVSIVEPILEAVIEIIAVLWEDVLKPLGEGLMAIVMPAFKIIVDVIKSLMPVIKAVIDILQWLWDQILEPIVKFLLDVVVNTIKIIASIVGVVIKAVVAYWENLIKIIGVGWGILKTGFLAIYHYIKDKVIDPLLKLWDKLKSGWNKMWDGIKSGAKSAINWVLGKVEDFINGIIKGINLLSSGFRKIGNKIFDIIGVDIKFEPLSTVKLPRLETGTNEVPYEGIYHLHPGEAVVPKKYNPALGNGGNDETNQKLDTLIGIMNNMNFTNVVNIGNETLYKKQQRYNKMQNDKYGTTVNL